MKQMICKNNVNGQCPTKIECAHAKPHDHHSNCDQVYANSLCSICIPYEDTKEIPEFNKNAKFRIGGE